MGARRLLWVVLLVAAVAAYSWVFVGPQLAPVAQPGVPGPASAAPS